jgi:hypothetical protein
MTTAAADGFRAGRVARRTGADTQGKSRLGGSLAPPWIGLGAPKTRWGEAAAEPWNPGRRRREWARDGLEETGQTGDRELYCRLVA